MRKVILLVCAVALLTSLATMAMASDTSWCIYIRTGFLSGTAMSNGGDLVLGGKTGQADSPFTAWVSTGGNIASDNGTAMQKIEFKDIDTVPPIEYVYNATLGVGTGYNKGNAIYISAWSGSKYGLSTGYDMPTTYQVTIRKGEAVLGQWMQADMWVGASTPAAGIVGKVGFWYTYDSMVGSFPESTDDFTVTIGPVPEPGSMLALGSGLLGMLGFAIRRRRA